MSVFVPKKTDVYTFKVPIREWNKNPTLDHYQVVLYPKRGDMYEACGPSTATSFPAKYQKEVANEYGAQTAYYHTRKRNGCWGKVSFCAEYFKDGTMDLISCVTHEMSHCVDGYIEHTKSKPLVTHRGERHAWLVGNMTKHAVWELRRILERHYGFTYQMPA